MIAKRMKEWLTAPFRSPSEPLRAQNIQVISETAQETLSVVRSSQQRFAVIDQENPRVSRVYHSQCEQKIEAYRSTSGEVQWHTASENNTRLSYIAVFATEEQRQKHQEVIASRTRNILSGSLPMLARTIEI